MVLSIPEGIDLSRFHKLWLAYSGGVDSHVLLHLLATDPGICAGTLQAIHINHGISPVSAQWQTHCETTCAALGVPLHCRSLHLEEGYNLEARAREERYRIFNSLLGENDCLLLAHHQDDQMETMLYHLLRGSGVRGLSGMPTERVLGQGMLQRPLLSCSRQEILNYAQQHQLTWVEDESNTDTAFDRNYLRQKVLPLLEERWPGFRNAWQRSAGLLADADECLQALAEADLGEAGLQTLPLNSLAGLTPARRRNALKYWLQRFSVRYGLPGPDFQSLQRIHDEVIPAREDAVPMVSWRSAAGQVDVRRFADTLYVMKARHEPSLNALYWDLNDALDMGEELGCLSLEPAGRGESGLSLDKLDSLEVRFRVPGLEAKPAGRRTRSLKKLFQDYRVPPWLRDHTPLLFAGDELVAVGDLFICDKWMQKEGKNLARICWQRSDLHCGC